MCRYFHLPLFRSKYFSAGCPTYLPAFPSPQQDFSQTVTCISGFLAASVMEFQCSGRDFTPSISSQLTRVDLILAGFAGGLSACGVVLLACLCFWTRLGNFRRRSQTRCVAVQVQCTYKFKRISPRFVPLPDFCHGAPEGDWVYVGESDVDED